MRQAAEKNRLLMIHGMQCINRFWRKLNFLTIKNQCYGKICTSHPGRFAGKLAFDWTDNSGIEKARATGPFLIIIF
jgi:hypothetical protein